jgi:protein tyrosine phosphatase
MYNFIKILTINFEFLMRIVVMDKLFDYDGIGNIVSRHVANPSSYHITVKQVVSALHIEQKNEGVSALFKKCISQFGKYDDEKRRDQLAEAIFHSYNTLKMTASASELDAMKNEMQPVLEKAAKYDALFHSIVSETTSQTTSSVVIAEKDVEVTREAIPEADAWLSTQKLSLAEIEKLAYDSKSIEAMNKKTFQFADEYTNKNGLTKNDGKVLSTHLCLHGVPFDQNRLGKIGETEITYADGRTERKNRYHPGFEGFFIAASKIEMPHGNYDLMQAPLVKHDDKVDTVQDFWDTVVVMRKSPIIVTVHDPKEKIPRFGYPQRAEYWTAERFATPMNLRNGWQLSRVGDDVEVAKSTYYPDIRIVKRSFFANNQETNESHIVTQFHLEGWPDHCGTPDHELFDTLLDAVDKEIEERNISTKDPITAHCAAGQGRSPLFAISHLLRRELKSRLQAGENIDEITLNFAKTVYRFNNQRPSQLGGADQWQSSLLALRRFYLKHKGLSNEEIRTEEVKFEKQVFEKAAEKLSEAIQKNASDKKRELPAIDTF